MPLTDQQKNELKKIIQIAKDLLKEAEKPSQASAIVKGEPTQRTRRSGAELSRFRKQLKSERRAGVPVAEMARKYGVSASYIYQLR